MTKPVVDIRALANLSRLEVSDDEVAKLEQEIPGILAFVETIQKADTAASETSQKLRNVMRPDTDPYEPGTFTETLLKAAPARTGDRIAVKQVIKRGTSH